MPLDTSICFRKPAAFSLSAPGGGEGWGEVGEPPAAAHLTLPVLRAGPLPLPPRGGEGKAAAWYE
jgi:hypothetical protein